MSKRDSSDEEFVPESISDSSEDSGRSFEVGTYSIFDELFEVVETTMDDYDWEYKGLSGGPDGLRLELEDLMRLYFERPEPANKASASD